MTAMISSCSDASSCYSSISYLCMCRWQQGLLSCSDSYICVTSVLISLCVHCKRQVMPRITQPIWYQINSLQLSVNIQYTHYSLMFISNADSKNIDDQCTSSLFTTVKILYLLDFWMYHIQLSKVAQPSPLGAIEGCSMLWTDMGLPFWYPQGFA